MLARWCKRWGSFRWWPSVQAWINRSYLNLLEVLESRWPWGLVCCVIKDSDSTVVSSSISVLTLTHSLQATVCYIESVYLSSGWFICCGWVAMATSGCGREGWCVCRVTVQDCAILPCLTRCHQPRHRPGSSPRQWLAATRSSSYRQQLTSLPCS